MYNKRRFCLFRVCRHSRHANRGVNSVPRFFCRNCRGATVAELAFLISSSALVLMMSLPQLVASGNFFAVDFYGIDSGIDDSTAATAPGGGSGGNGAEPGTWNAGSTGPRPGSSASPTTRAGGGDGSTSSIPVDGVSAAEAPGGAPGIAMASNEGGGTDEALQHAPVAPPIGGAGQKGNASSQRRGTGESSRVSTDRPGVTGRPGDGGPPDVSVYY